MTTTNIHREEILGDFADQGDPAYAAHWQELVEAHYAGTIPEDDCSVCESEAPDTSELSSPAGLPSHAPEPNQYGKHASRTPDSNCYVNVYLSSLGYGGPEEGGWWYDINTIERVIPTQRKFAEEIKTRLQVDDSEFSNKDRRPKHSVLSDGVYVICIEDEPGETTPKERPRYE